MSAREKVAATELKLSRRAAMAGGAALTFAVGGTGLLSVARADAAGAKASLDANAWIRIGTDNVVTVIFPITEMGQGSSTALPLILAEELDADWDLVEVEQLDRDDRTYGNPVFGNVLYTAGSTGVYGYFDTLRKAGAQARALLIAWAADHLAVAAEDLITEPSLVVHPPSGRRLSYGDIAALPGGDLSVPQIDDGDLKPRKDYRLLGQFVPRRDIPAKSNGTETYAFDVWMPGMLYAAVRRSPIEGERPVTVDDKATLDTPGVLRTLELPDGVAVIAESYEAAVVGKDALEVDWSTTSPARKYDSDTTLENYASVAGDLDKPGAVWREQGDAPAAIASADRQVDAVYLSDYAYHAQLEPMAAVASVDPDGKGAEVWAGTQTQSWTMHTITEVLGTTPDRIRLHMMTMGGSFGRRTALMQEYVRDALLTSKAMGAPVKVSWSREDDLKQGWFRPAAAQLVRAGLTADGKLAGWHHRVATPSVIAYFNPVRWSQVDPNDIISMRGSENKFYDLPDITAEHLITERGARLAPWRGIGASYTSYAAEAFMDELAEAAGADPVEFRLALLQNNPRGRQLIERVADMSGWGKPPEEGRALGVAFAGYGDTMAAGVAEIDLDEDDRIRVHLFWAAVDAGLVVSPDNALAQIEGGIVFGLGSALKERITIKGGEVQESNFYVYEIMRANEVPTIEIDLQSVDAPPTGIGEAGTPMVAPAIANAFHALKGNRLRHMPFTPERVRSARS
ncbi:MAG: molybdopterin cofactor-binding domain-containing protein [Geminicoccaceae bacterium]